MTAKQWGFYALLSAQWLVVLPMTVYASERFEDMYDRLETGGEPVLVLPADPDAAIHFGILMVALVALSLLLVYLRHQQGGRFRSSSFLLIVPPMLCVALRAWVGCLTCTQ